MKILHYSLGMPPYRSGGLTKYATDLMKAEQRMGHQVCLLWPGRMRLKYKLTRINEPKFQDGIRTYEIVNPLPVPLLNGIMDIDAYTEAGSKSVYKFFLVKHGFDVIHVHTLMGIHKEFFEVAKELKVKIVYTTHDYFGICSKVSLFNKNEICDMADGCVDCEECNKSALSLKKIKILQSPAYRLFKDSRLVKSIRANFKKNNKVNDTIKYTKESIHNPERVKDYKKLRSYYNEMFQMVDIFHFNSSNTRNIFEKYINIKDSKVIPISHNGILDNRRIKTFNGKLKITYLGAAESYKGFYLIKQVLDDLYNEGYKDIELNVYSNTNKLSPYMKVQNGYKINQLGQIFEKTDLLVVPSVWNETFGFVALEGLSYGVPVLLTTRVGAKDIFEDGKTGIIVEPRFEDIKEKITMIYEDKSRQMLININKNIVDSNISNIDFEKHVTDVLGLYEGQGRNYDSIVNSIKL